MICVEPKNFKAPNGNQSQLYKAVYDRHGADFAAKVYAHVRTPSFKEWFGDWENNPSEASKVTDDNGEPLVLWHGTTKDIQKDYKRDSEFVGFYATPNYEFAKKYGMDSAVKEGITEDQVNVKPLFMKLDNPRRFDSNEVEYSTVSAVSEADANRWKALGNDGLHYMEQQAVTSKGRYEEYVAFNSDDIYELESLSTDNSRATVKSIDPTEIDLLELNEAVETIFEGKQQIYASDAAMEMSKYLSGNLKDLLNEMRTIEDTKVSFDFDENTKKSTYMYYNPNNDTIYLSRKRIYENGSTQSLFEGFMHELIHSYTSKTLYNPETTAEKNFANNMERYFKQIKNKKFKNKGYGFKDVHEFVSEIMTNSEFVEEIQSREPTLIDRILALFSKFFTTKSGREIYVDTVADILGFINYQNEARERAATNEVGIIQETMPIKRVKVRTKDKVFFNKSNLEKFLLKQKNNGLANKRYNDKIYVKADSEGSNNLAKAIETIKNINNRNEGLLELQKEQAESRNAGRDVYTVRINDNVIERNNEEFRERQREANEHIIPIDDYYQIRPVKYTLKLTKALREIEPNRKTIRLPDENRPYLERNLRKKLQSKGVNDLQINTLFEYMREKGINEISTEDLITSLEADLAYTVETEFSNIPYLSKQEDITEEEYNNINVPEEIEQSIGDGTSYNKNAGGITYRKIVYNNGIITYKKLIGDYKPTQIYQDYSVQGGTNYKEFDIRTPSVEPAIKSHAEFASQESIGWYRADEVVKIPNLTEEENKRYLELVNIIEDTNRNFPETSKQKEEFDRLNEKRNNKKEEGSNIRRILEFQSDLFQKGRGKRVLTQGVYKAKDGLTYWSDSARIQLPGEEVRQVRVIRSENFTYGETFTPLSNLPQDVLDYFRLKSDTVYKQLDNQFLQFLNKENNWVRFFIQSIIQDSANQGYSKVRFPRKDTISAIELYPNLEDQRERARKELERAEKNVNNILNNLDTGKWQLKNNGWYFIYKGITIRKDDRGFFEIIRFQDNGIEYKTYERLKRDLKSAIDTYNDSKITFDHLNTENKEVESVKNFYESTVKNILDKIYGKDNIEEVTDDNGYEWYEYTIQESDYVNPVYLQNETFNDQLTPENRQDFERKKQIMMDNFPHVVEVTEDYNLDAAGKLENNGRVIRVNPKYWTEATLGHEFGHLLIDLMGGLENPLVQKALNELKGSALWERIQKDYSDASPEVIQKEVLAEAIGQDSQTIYENLQDQAERERRMNNWERILMRIFNKLKQLLHIEKSTVRKLARMVVEGPPSELQGEIEGEYYSKKSETENENVQQINSLRDNVNKDIDKVEKLRQQAIDSLNNKIAIYQQRGDSEKVSSLNEQLEEMKQSAPVDALAKFASLAAKHTNFINKRYEDIKEKIDNNEVTNKELIKFFGQWYDYLGAFDILEDVQNQFTQQLTVSGVKSKYPRLYNLLNETISTKNMLKSLYREEGVPLAANFLYKYDTRIINEFKLNKEKDWRAINPKETRDVISKIKDLEKPLETYKEKDFKNIGLSNKQVKFLQEYIRRNNINGSNGKTVSDMLNVVLDEMTDENGNKKPMEDYIYEQSEANIEELRRKTYESLLNELEKASMDINVISRWWDSLLDSNDEVIASMVKAFNVADDYSRIESLTVRDEMVELTRELEKHVGYSTMDNPEDLYDFMIEKGRKIESMKDILVDIFSYSNKVYSKGSDGKWYDEDNNQISDETIFDMYTELYPSEEKTQHYITAFYSEFFESFKAYRNSIYSRDDLNMNEKNKEIRKWKDRNTTFYTEGFQRDRRKFMREKLVDKGIMSQSEYNTVVDDEAISTSHKIEELVNPEATSEIKRWMVEHEWDYRTPKDERWLNPQFENLKKLRKKGMVNGVQTNPMIKFYDYIVNKNREIDRYLPFKYRLDTRLPSVSKTFIERLRSFHNIGKAIKGSARKGTTKRPEDVERGQVEQGGKQRQQLQDENGNIKMFMPIYYNNVIPVEEQSFDLASIYNSRFRMGIDYKHKSDILPEMELTKFLVENRDVTVTDSKGNKVTNALRKLKNKEITKRGLNSQISAQLGDWFKNQVYGRKDTDLGEFNIFGAEVDMTKFLDQINSYSALNLLGLNFLQGTANLGLGQVMQIIEAQAGEYYTMNDYRKAGATYTANFGGILADIGSRNPKNKINKLAEFFDILNDFDETSRFRKHTRTRQILQSNSLFFTSKAGEHQMQSQAMIAMLKNKPIKNKKGEVMQNKKGNTLTMYDILIQDEKTGNIKIDPKYKDADITMDDVLQRGRAMKRILSRLHGEYSKLGQNALQRHAIGRMALMFRKFIAPGYKRRLELGPMGANGERQFKYNEISESWTEGSYRSTYRFLDNLARDLYKYKFDLAAAKSNWDQLTNVERYNIKRTIGEVGALVSAYVLSHAALTMLGEDDLDEKEKWWLEFMAFQALRLRSELMFFIDPTESMRLLRSPAASMSLIQNSIELIGLIVNPFDDEWITSRFERGNREGQLKIMKPIQNIIPVYKQIPRIEDMEGSLNWFRN